MEKQFFWMKMRMKNTNDFLILSFVFNIPKVFEFCSWTLNINFGMDFEYG